MAYRQPRDTNTHPVIFLILRRMRIPLLVLIFVYAVAVLGYVLIPGVDEQGEPYRMSFFHAFYFVSFMGSTIGFGELPHPFTHDQRLWTLVTIYATVISWLYAIGTVISLLQDPVFRRALTHNQFVRSVKRMSQPFYLVCGAGDTGTMVIRALTDRGIRAVAVDRDQNVVDSLQLEHFVRHVPAAMADASQSQVLLDAGLKHRNCAGLLALTLSDDVNLKVAITAKLLNPRLMVICRAETEDAARNMASFLDITGQKSGHRDYIINPYEAFAETLKTNMSAPARAEIRGLLTAVPGSKVIAAKSPPVGRWLVCGYGRFGKAVNRVLTELGSTTTIIELDPERTNSPAGSIKGRGTEAITLREAGIERADGLVAATDDDTNNLSIVLTATDLLPDLYSIARQSRTENTAIFRAAKLPLVFQSSEIISSRILEAIMTPLTEDFLSRLPEQSPRWIESLYQTMHELAGGTSTHGADHAGKQRDHLTAPETWVLALHSREYPVVCQYLEDNELRLGDLLRNPQARNNQLTATVLMIKRRNERVMTPELSERLQIGDELLIAGNNEARARMRATLTDSVTLEYCSTGKRLARGWLWKKLVGRTT